MKIRLLLFLLLFSYPVLVFTQIDSIFNYGCRYTKSKIPMVALSPEEQANLEWSNSRSDTIDIINYAIDLEATYSSRLITSTCTITFTPVLDGVSTIELDLLDLQIDSVYSVQGPLSYTYSGVLLEVELSEIMMLGDTSQITIQYSGQPRVDPTGFGGLAFEDDIIYNLGIGLGSNPYNFGRSWFPCFDNFIERSTYDLTITTGENKKAYCIGRFIEEIDLGEGRFKRSYRMNTPIPTYLVGFAASQYTTTSDIHEGLEQENPILLIAKPSDMGAMNASFVELKNAIDALEAWFGPYVFDQVGYVLTPRGAMEHASLIAYPDFVGTGGPTFAANRLMAHELGHHWWGNITTLSSAADMWIKEGNAEYCAHLFTEYTLGQEEFIKQVRNNMDVVLSDAHLDDGAYLSLSGLPYENTYGTHTYLKGAAMIHNLRGYLGDTLFSHGMTALLEANAFGAVDADKFKEDLSAFTGVDLNPFFDAWIYNPGYSDFEFETWSYTPSGDQYLFEATIQQKLLAAPAYHIAVPMEVTFFAADGATHTARFTVSDEISTISLMVPFEPLFQVMNHNQLLNLGRMQDYNLITTTGTTFFSNVTVNSFNVSNLPEPTPVNIVHHLVAADEDLANGFQVSNSHYWSVAGDFPDGFEARMSFNYDGRNESDIDFSIMQNSEDSLLLLWRANPWDDWEVHPDYTKLELAPGDGFGFIRVNTILSGDYTFGSGSIPVSTQVVSELSDVQFYPNPAREHLQVEGILEQNGPMQLRLVDALGRTGFTMETFVTDNWIEASLPLKELASGIYTLQVWDRAKGLLSSKKVLIQY